jgi:hypothetical protein
MRVMVIVKANKESEAGKLPDAKCLAEMGRFNETLFNAGVMLAGEGLHASARGKRVRVAKSGSTVTDGPFAETKELIAGFWIWKVASMAEAVEWAQKCPMEDGSELEIRPVIEAEDFGGALSSELRDQEDRHRKQFSRQ